MILIVHQKHRFFIRFLTLMDSSMGLELAFHISDLKRILTAEDRYARKIAHLYRN